MANPEKVAPMPITEVSDDSDSTDDPQPHTSRCVDFDEELTVPLSDDSPQTVGSVSSVSKETISAADGPTSSSMQSKSSEDEEPTSIANERLMELSRQREISLIHSDTMFYLGIPASEKRVIGMLVEHVCERDILLTLKKIKTNDSNKRLGYDFGVSTSTAQRIFTATALKLSKVFAQFIFWPPSENIKMLMPIQFRLRFSKVESIIECYEIQIEKPQDPTEQALTWSEYKKCNTVKVLISTTPYGLINFVSDAYGGRTSDEEMVVKSGYLNVVPPNSEVLADRGFKQVEAALLAKNVRLVRPASVEASVKATKSEIRGSELIRIHIERLISRLRNFHLLHPHATIDHSLVRLVDHCIVIACGIINLHKPIVGTNLR